MFPPYFVLGAAFSGFAVVSMIAVVLRRMLGFEELVSERHLDMLEFTLDRLTVVSDDDHAFAGVASRSPQKIILMPADGGGQVVFAAEEIDGSGFSIIQTI